MARRITILAIAVLAAVSCQPSQSTIATAISQTQQAAPPAASPTSPPPTTPPTLTAEPRTRTQRPSPTAGPLSLTDDFSSDSGIWEECNVCSVEAGTLHMGPYPTSGAYVQHVAICAACGIVTNYRMAVDATYIDGPSERGFGLLARHNEDHMITYEITPWQTMDLWDFAFEKGQWKWINGTFSGLVRPGKQLNHIELEALTNPSGTVDIYLTVNGRTPIVVFSQPAEPGSVGLTLWGHALEVSFDNFEFHTEDSPIFPRGSPASSG